MAIDRRVKKIVRELEDENAQLRAQLEAQGVEVSIVARSAMELRQEETRDLARYQRRITELTKFVEEIAATKSKFAAPAKKLLGIS